MMIELRTLSSSKQISGSLPAIRVSPTMPWLTTSSSTSESEISEELSLMVLRLRLELELELELDLELELSELSETSSLY